MKTRFLYTVVAVAVLLLTASCGKTIVPNKHYVSNTITETYPQFDKIAVSGSIDLDVVVGSQAMSVYGADNVIPYVEMHVVDGTLHIRYSENVTIVGDDDTKVFVALPQLAAVTVKGDAEVDVHGTSAPIMNLLVEGSGEIDVENMAVSEVQAEVNGSGNISLQGVAQAGTYRVSGSGDIDANELSIVQLTAEVSGTGSIECYVTERLTATTKGMGEIEYQGPPALVVESNGGNIRRDI